MGICQSLGDDDKKTKKKEDKKDNVVHVQEKKEDEPHAPQKQTEEPAKDPQPQNSNDIEAFFEDEPKTEEQEADLENEESEDSSDMFELNVRKFNANNLENADELGDDFGIGIINKDELAGNPLFQLDEAQDGECFMAIKPWLGAIVEPENALPNDATAPNEELKINWVYGYAGHVRNSIGVNNNGELLFPAASIVTAYDPNAHTQRTHFLGATDDITSFAQHPENKNIIAVGQVATIQGRRGMLPHISVWNSETGEEWKLPNAHKRAVRCLAFSPNGKYLASVGDDNDYTVAVWDWENKQKICDKTSGNSKIYHLRWNPVDEKEFIAVGRRTILFFEFESSSGGLSSRRGILGSKYKRQSFYCATFSAKGYALVGAHDGTVYILMSGKVRAVKKVHNGAIYCIETSDDGEQFYSGSYDKTLIISDNKLNQIAQHQFDQKVRAITKNSATGGLYVGISNAVYKVDDINNSESKQLLFKTHFNGELWALDKDPSNSNRFVTAGEDNCIYVWDSEKHKLIGETIISETKGPKYKRRSAGTTSTEPPNRCCRGIAFHPNGSEFVIGTNSGEVRVFALNANEDGTVEIKQTVCHDLNQYGKRNVTNQKQNWIQTLKYSPNGKMVAVGTHGIVICLLDAENGYEVKKSLKTHNSAIVNIDWSADSSHIQSTCMGYELLFHDIDTENADASAHNSQPSSLKDIDWQTHSCTFGWPVQGIYETGWDGTDVNIAAKNGIGHNATIIATGDDFGKVNLFRYPCLEQSNEKKAFSGHSSHVMNVVFSENTLYSAGGNDKTIIQWDVIGSE